MAQSLNVTNADPNCKLGFNKGLDLIGCSSLCRDKGTGPFFMLCASAIMGYHQKDWAWACWLSEL